MSYTEIYKIKEDCTYEFIDEVQNARAAAMYLWNHIAREYFNLKCMPMFNRELSNKIWNAHSHVKLPVELAIVLKATMDGATIVKDDMDKFLGHIDVVATALPESAYSGIHDTLKDVKLEDGEVLAFNCCSISDFWMEDCPDKRFDIYKDYQEDINKGDVK